MAARPWTKEQRQARAAMMRAKWRDPEWRAKRLAAIRKAHRGHPMSEETKRKMRGKRSPRGWALFEILERRYGADFVARIPEPEVDA